MDLHEDIHRAIENYLDVNEFRRWLNSAIQNSRGVTWLIQKRKSKWPDFEDWYGEWQEDARINSVLAWGVTARNRVVKEEDLQTYSEARVSLYGDRLKEAEEVWHVPPETTVEMIVTGLTRASKERPTTRSGMIRVQRRWVDDQLPDHELVAALREMYRAVASIVSRAHKAGGVDVCDVPPFKRRCVTAEIQPHPRCLPHGDPLPSLMYNLATGDLSKYHFEVVERDDAIVELGKKRYRPRTEFTRDPIAHALERLDLSKEFLEKDGYASPSLALFRRQEVRFHSLVFTEGEPRELKVAAAVEAEGAWPFDGAVYSSETWVGLPGTRGSLFDLDPAEMLDSNSELFNPDPDARDEALFVIALCADGRSRELLQPFARTTKGIVYSPLQTDDSGENIPDLLSPLGQRWPPKGNRQRT